MKKFIAIMMVLGLVGFAMAQDLDTPVSGTPAPDAEVQGGAASVYDMLIARITQGASQILNDRTRNWRGAWWEIWAWERGANASFNEFQSWGRFSGTDLTGAYADYDAQRDALSAAEQAAIQQLANESHRRIMAAGLN